MKFPLVSKKQWEVIKFDDHPNHDSIWAMATGADGHVYIGLCCERTGGGVAQLYRYNVQRRKLEHCLDMAEVTGEPGDDGHATQGKIHFALCPVSDGTMFGATHCTTPPAGHLYWNPYGMWGDPLRNFIGAHIFHYDPHTGKAVDFGVVRPNEGIPFLLLDESRGRLYGMTYPKAHFFRVNLAGRGMVDYGRVSSWYSVAMALDPDGNVFIGDANARLIKYDVRQDRLIFFDSATFSYPWTPTKRYAWLCNFNMAEDEKIYGTNCNNDHLYRFDPKEPVPQFEDLGLALPEIGDAGALGNAHRGPRSLVPDGHGHLYYIVYPSGVSFEKGLPLFVRLNLSSMKREVIGTLCVDGIRISSWHAVLDHEGNIYMKAADSPISLAIYRPKA